MQRSFFTDVSAQRFIAVEVQFCASCTRLCQQVFVERFFAAISRAGDGVFWYGLMAALPIVYGDAAWRVSLLMALVGLVNLFIYKLIKTRTRRERPYVQHPGVHASRAPLDRYSFPSGHTLHAVAFTLVATAYYPELALLLAPFTVCVAASRIVLGLHYPTDVVAGALLGAVTGYTALLIA